MAENGSSNGVEGFISSGHLSACAQGGGSRANNGDGG